MLNHLILVQLINNESVELNIVKFPKIRPISITFDYRKEALNQRRW